MLGCCSFCCASMVTEGFGQRMVSLLALREDHRLVMDGPYRWVRHPRAAASFAFGTALILESANLVITLPSVALMGFVFPRIRKEEAMMIERFGDRYRAYVARTGRFLPRLTTEKRV